MSEKNNPIEGIMDLINQYTKEDVSKLDLESAKDKLSSLLKDESLKGSLGNMAGMMNVLPMVDGMLNQRNHKGIRELLEEILQELKQIKKCTCHKKHHCYKEYWEHMY